MTLIYAQSLSTLYLSNMYVCMYVCNDIHLYFTFIQYIEALRKLQQQAARLTFQYEVIALKKLMTTYQYDNHDDDNRYDHNLDHQQQQQHLDHSMMISSSSDKQQHHHYHHSDYNDDDDHHQESKISFQINIRAITDDVDDDYDPVLNDVVLLVYTNLIKSSDSSKQPKCYVFPVSTIIATNIIQHHHCHYHHHHQQQQQHYYNHYHLMYDSYLFFLL